MPNKPQSFLTEMFLSALDKLLRPETTLIGRLFTFLIMFALVLIWYKGEALMEIYKQSKFENYQEAITAIREHDFQVSATEQLQIAYMSSGADFAAVYEFKPKNINNFYSIVAHEGDLPTGINPDPDILYPIDKSSIEYRTQLTGQSYYSSKQFDFLPISTKNKPNIGYLFSCPIFNIDNIYSGMVSMMWKDGEEHLDNSRLDAICGQAVRTLGRIK